MEFLFIIAILIMSVVIHETAHGWMALYLGDPTAKYAGRLTLNPLKHLDPIGSVLVPLAGYLTGGFIIGWAKPVPFNPNNLRSKWGEGLVAAAGPLSNIAVATVFGLFLRYLYPQGLLSENFVFMAGYLVFINIILAIFNLIPLPPLDGSKIIFSLLPYRFQYIRHNIERYGLVLVLLAVFFVWQFIYPLAVSIFGFIVGSPLL